MERSPGADLDGQTSRQGAMPIAPGETRLVVPPSSDASQDIRVTEVTHWEDLDPREVDRLVIDCVDGTFFQLYGWLRAWWETFGGSHHLRIFTARAGGRLVGFAPLYERRAGRKILDVRPIGEPHSDYSVFPCAGPYGERVVESIMQSVLAQYSGVADVRFTEVPRDSEVGRWLAAHQSVSGRVQHLSETPCPRLRRDSGPSPFQAASCRKSIVRHTKKLGSLGAIEVRHISSPEDIEARLETFFRQHIERWSVTPHPSLFLDAENRQFYRALVRHMGEAGAIVLTEIRAGERPVAYHFGLSCGTDFIWYKPSFEIRLSKVAPGEVLLGELFRFVHDQPVEVFDFTRGGEAFKTRFCSEVRYNDSYIAHSGRVAALARSRRERLKSTLRAAHARTVAGGNLDSLLRSIRRQAAAARSLRQFAGLGRDLGRGAIEWIRSTREIAVFVHRADMNGTPVSCGLDAGIAVRSVSLHDLLSIRPPDTGPNSEFLQLAFQRLNTGDQCFVLEANGRLAAVGWVTARSPIAISEIDAELTFGDHAVCLYHMEVLPEFRGRGLYVHLLRGTLAALSGRDAVIFALSTNLPSVRGIRQAGFDLCALAVRERFVGKSKWRCSYEEGTATQPITIGSAPKARSAERTRDQDVAAQ